MEWSLLMSEYQKPWGDNDVFEWFTTVSQEDIIIPIGKGTGVGFSLIDALAGINNELENGNYELAQMFLRGVAELIIANSYGFGKEALDDLIVELNMLNIDEDIETILRHAEEDPHNSDS